VPTDFDILEVLDEKGRNVPGNIALELDKSRGYIRSELPDLVDYGLARKIGPLEDSGLYEITEKGRLAVEHRDRYDEDDLDFEAFLNDRLND